tara:strand:+ start:1770 stop:1901 length:132 start_codon:yes stop_codon:yes gene_type:complete
LKIPDIWKKQFEKDREEELYTSERKGRRTHNTEIIAKKHTIEE